MIYTESRNVNAKSYEIHETKMFKTDQLFM